LRINIAAFIAGGSLLLFLPAVPEHWPWLCIAIIVISLFGVYINYSHIKYGYVSSAFLATCCFALGFAWNANYAQERLGNILSIEYEGKDLILEGRVNALPQSSANGAKFSFEIDQAFFGRERIEPFPLQVYLS